MWVYTIYNEITWNPHLLKFTTSLVIIIPMIPKKSLHIIFERKTRYWFEILKMVACIYYVTEECRFYKIKLVNWQSTSTVTCGFSQMFL